MVADEGEEAAAAVGEVHGVCIVAGGEDEAVRGARRRT